MSSTEDDGRIGLFALIPLLCTIGLMQMTIPVLRIATSYRAMELGLGAWEVGVLSSGFALLPVFFAVRIGRYNDRHGEGASALAGVAVVVAAFVGLWKLSFGFAAMLAFTCMLGIGHVLMLSAVQMMTTRCSGPAGHDKVLGYFLVAASVGQMAGPLVMGLATPRGEIYPDQSLFTLLAVAMGALVLSTLALWRAIPSPGPAAEGARLPLGAIFRTRGLWAVLLANSICSATSDIVLVFYPVLAAEQGVSAATVGYLFSLRALATLGSRFFFVHLVRALGKPALMMTSLVATALSTAALGLPMPVAAMGLLLAVSGFTIGLAIGTSLSLTIEIAPAESKATAMSMRLTISRIAQFGMPIGAGVLATALGTGGIFAVSGICLLVCWGILNRAKPGR